MAIMNVRLQFCFVCAVLLVGCGKSSDRDHSQSKDASIPESTRTKRSERAEAPASRRQNLRNALAAALQLEASAARDKALAAVVRNAFEPAPDIAAEAFAQLPVDSEKRIITIRYLAALRAGNNPGEALVWADSLGSALEILTAKEEIARVVVKSDPARATQVLLDSGSANREFSATAKQVIRNWVDTAPKDAVAWGLSLPAGETRRAGIQAVVSQWLEADSKAAFVWVASLDNQAVRKESMHAMAQALAAQPEPIRELYLANVNAATLSELKPQLDQITEKSANQKPPAAK
jgi:hypothetical protein